MSPTLSLIICLFILTSCNQRYDYTSNQNNHSIKVAFGSCSDEDKEQKLWHDIVSEYPDIWIWLGDNIYGDSTDPEVLDQKYRKQKKHKLYQVLRNNSTILGIWDDHDYGINDGGKEHPRKDESQTSFLNFIDAPMDDIRRSRAGVYHSYIYSKNDIDVKVILLDTRYFRDELLKDGKVCKPNKNGSILGPDQWYWLEQELNNSRADIHIIASSIQVIPNEHRFEKWSNFPNEKAKLLNLIHSSEAANSIFISGDRHVGEISKLEWKGTEIYDITSSSLTHGWKTKRQEANAHRVGPLVYDLNYGIIEITKSTGADIKIDLSLKSMKKEVKSSAQIKGHTSINSNDK